MHLRSVWESPDTTLRRWLGHTTQPYIILFPIFAVLVLGIIWGTTLHLIKVERAGAVQSAVAATQELTDTYEAQVVRALREIDQTLKFVKYAYELKGEKIVLSGLKDRALLPPELVFVVSITDAKGDVVASTRPTGMANVADQNYFQEQRRGDGLSMGGRPRGQTGKWKLQFSRRLNAADGTFAGIVIVSVDADYFVSGYEPVKLGEYGTLGILGTDGVFRVRRRGGSIFYGDVVDYASMVPSTDLAGTEAVVSAIHFDGVRRYTSGREIYGFPLAVIVGLSEDEQLAAVHKNMYYYLGWAAVGSLLLITIVAVLGRMSWRLGQNRLREIEAKAAREHAEKVEYLAYHDSLTSLPNRSLFNKLLSQGISQAHRYNRPLAVLFLDLDHFKQINDTLGHEAGDQLLQETATRLQSCLRDSDTVARLGGDEFVVLLPQLDEEKYAATVAKKILAAIAKPFPLLEHEFRVTTSIGISTYPQDGLDEHTLMKNADVAMYQAKQEGKNNFQFYSEELNASSLERLNLEAGLRHALQHHEFQLHYQAKRDIPTGRITGMEALLRWQHPELGMVAPMRFIPIAEEIGLIVPIGKWVLKAACQQNVAWQKQGLPHLNMAVNLTARQFSDENLLTDLAAILMETGMDGHLLEIEITESLLIHDIDKTLQILTGLKAMGIRIAIDDFGAGYSSLSTLKKFPLDTIKIDRSFIQDDTNIVADQDLTKAIISMGKTLSLTVVAQGVETKEQADFLREHACDEFQGFYFNKPVPADQFAELLQV